MLSNQAGGNLIGPNDFSAAAPRKGQREQGQAHSSKEKFQIGLGDSNHPLSPIFISQVLHLSGSAFAPVTETSSRPIISF